MFWWKFKWNPGLILLCWMFTRMNWQLFLLLYFYSVSTGKFTTIFPPSWVLCGLCYTVSLLYDIIQLIEQHISCNVLRYIAGFHYFCALFPAEKHHLRYFLSASSGVTNQPEFVAHLVIDNLQGGYCDSNGKIPKPRDDWAIKMIHEDPKQLELYANECVRYQHAYRAHIENIKQQFNQSGGMIRKRINLVTVMLAKEIKNKISEKRVWIIGLVSSPKICFCKYYITFISL